MCVYLYILGSLLSSSEKKKKKIQKKLSPLPSLNPEKTSSTVFS